MFGEGIEGILSELSEPVLLEFPARNLGPLQYKVDCGLDEWYMEKGPVDISKATVVDY